jgi:DNA-binding transcriptional ArsR family regulator
MGTSKAILFSEEQNKLASIAKVFGHPARIAIIQYLIANRTCIVSNLIDELPLSQSTISQHLKELKNIGMIRGEIEGPTICYCLNQDMLKELAGILNKINKEIKDCC